MECHNVVKCVILRVSEYQSMGSSSQKRKKKKTFTFTFTFTFTMQEYGKHHLNLISKFSITQNRNDIMW